MSNTSVRSANNFGSRVFCWSLLVLFSFIALSSSFVAQMAEAKPLVGMQKTADGEDRVIGVNVPWIYTMDLLTGKKGSDLGINVLSGLVRVNVDSRRKVNGRRPVSVSLFGTKLYDSFPSAVEEAAANGNDQFESSSYQESSKKSSKVKAPASKSEFVDDTPLD